jgi:hypothetical protein
MSAGHMRSTNTRWLLFWPPSDTTTSWRLTLVGGNVHSRYDELRMTMFTLSHTSPPARTQSSQQHNNGCREAGTVRGGRWESCV